MIKTPSPASRSTHAVRTRIEALDGADQLTAAAEAVTRHPDDVAFLTLYGRLLATDRPGEADAVFAKAYALAPSAALAVAWARIGLRLGRPLDALHRLDNDLVRAVTDGALMREACDLLHRIGDHNAVLLYAARGLAQTQDLDLLAVHNRALRRLADDAAAGLRPELRRLLLQANDRLLRRRPEEAIARFEQLVAKAPLYAPGWIGLRGACLAAKKPAEAKAVETRWAAAAPASVVQAGRRRPLSKRGLIFDPRQPSPTRNVDDALIGVASPEALRTTPNAKLVIDPGGRPVTWAPVLSSGRDLDPVTTVRTRTAQTFVAGLDHALLIGRGLTLTDKGEVLRELHVRNMAKYGALADGDLTLYDPTVFPDAHMDIRVFDTPAVSLVGATDKSFGDWLTSFAPRMALLRKAGLLDLPVVVGAETPPGFIDILVALGLRREQVLLHSPNEIALFPKLYVPSWPIRRLVHVMDGLFDDLKALSKPVPEGGARRRIYLSRERVPKRSLLNEAEVRETFVRHGFEVVHPELLGLEGTIRLLSEAALVGAPYGSALLNLAFTASEPVGVVCMPPYKPSFLTQTVVWLGSMGLKFALVMGDASDSAPDDLKDATWTVDIHQLEAAIAAAVAEREAR